MHSLRKTLQEKEGFTLLEILLAAVLMSLLLSLLMGFIVQSSQAFSLEDDLLTTAQTGELALEFIMSQLRMAGDYQIVDQNSIEFIGYYQEEKESLSFFPYISGGVWALGFRVGTGTARPLINHVKKIHFLPVEESIQITLTVKGKGGREITQKTWVKPRNL